MLLRVGLRRARVAWRCHSLRQRLLRVLPQAACLSARGVSRWCLRRLQWTPRGGARLLADCRAWQSRFRPGEELCARRIRRSRLVIARRQARVVIAHLRFRRGTSRGCGRAFDVRLGLHLSLCADARRLKVRGLLAQFWLRGLLLSAAGEGGGGWAGASVQCVSNCA